MSNIVCIGDNTAHCLPIISPSGAIVSPNGTIVSPGWPIVSPNGAIVSPGANIGIDKLPKIYFAGIPLTTTGGIVFPLVGQRVRIPFTTTEGIAFPPVGWYMPLGLTNVIVDSTQTKIFINGVPVSRYGAICSYGNIVIGSNINPKIFIE